MEGFFKSENHQDLKSASDEQFSFTDANKALTVLVNVFPRIRPEVFREMLTIFTGESSLDVIVEQLLSYEDKWVLGRWKLPSHGDVTAGDIHETNLAVVPVAERFRREGYKHAVQSALSQEFKALRKSTIAAVLAEHNFSYAPSRFSLREIASKSWRCNIRRFFSKWRRPDLSALDSHYMLRGYSSCDEEEPTKPPELRKSGDEELDEELNQSLIVPIKQRLETERVAKDWAFAMEINETEARNADALHECECCFADITLEQMATCGADGHVICFNCLSRAVGEVIFGQGGNQNIDEKSGQIKCLAPLLGDFCDGSIAHDVTRRAMSQVKGGREQLIQLESKLAEEALRKSQLPLIRCPFCTYAEVDDLYLPPTKIKYRFNASCNPLLVILIILSALVLLPIIWICFVLCRVIPFHAVPDPDVQISNSLARLCRSKYLPRRFHCQSPHCALRSCMICLKAWQDPHTCYESAALSLRTTIEMARTAALKRTCPRCGVSFIKESGCNKLTCVCGYMMCYVCREGLDTRPGEGYRHFCQHFRPAGGACVDCGNCDLYRAEDEFDMTKRAGEAAEREWRKREGMVGVQGIGGTHDDGTTSRWWGNYPTAQGLLDWWIQAVITC